jgi:hypothetical protein
MSTRTPLVRRRLAVGATAIGIAIGAAGVASAASGGAAPSTTTPGGTSGGAAPPAGAANPATAAHGPGETLLTGTTAEKVRAAALAAVPGGTIIRVETDSAGSPYEAHVTTAGGSVVTVKIGSDYKVTATQSGFGAP